MMTFSRPGSGESGFLWRACQRFLFGMSAAILLSSARQAAAGPPFLTDDPVPVDLHHWEVYLASQFASGRDGTSATAPHIEVNYGLARNVQVHTIVPMAYSKPTGMAGLWGPGDIELGVKFRFLEESKTRPQVGIFPLLEVPTGDDQRGLGSGQAQVFLPVWLQKSWGSWTSYGGGGYWVHPGPGNRDYWFGGWLLQKSITKRLAVGGELFASSSPAVGADGRSGFNLGLMYDIDESHHLLVSAGADLHAPDHGLVYAAYQWTFGPHDAASTPDAPSSADTR